MNRLIVKGIIFFAIATACATTQKDWNKRQASQAFQQEKALFKERLGGKELCAHIGIRTFTLGSNRPSKDCIYSAGGYHNNDGDISLYLKQLKVLQATSKGFLVEHKLIKCKWANGAGTTCYNSDESAPNAIFIHKTDEHQDIVDGSYLDDSADTSALYEYTGPFVYESALGTSKTVYSFKKFPTATIKSAQNGMKVYNPNDELFAELKLWRKLEESLQRE